MGVLPWVVGGLGVLALVFVLEWVWCRRKGPKCDECRDSIGLEGLEED